MNSCDYPMNVAAYLERIGASFDGNCTLEALKELTFAHLRAVNFENLDSFHGNLPSLEPEAIFEKVVTNRRGGYCFELNKLFYLLLQELGILVHPQRGDRLQQQVRCGIAPECHINGITIHIR